MATLPAHPNLDQLRHQAKDLLRAAQSGDEAAGERIRAVSARLTLSAAQLVIARSYGFSSWARLKAEVAARSASLEEKAAAFVEASIRDLTGRVAPRMLAETPELATHGFATALVLGDAVRVGEEIRRDPAAATRPDPRTGWTPLHAVCASRWHHLDPGRKAGLAATAMILLDAGADPNARIGPAGRTPLFCATAVASSVPCSDAIIQLLLERGAVVQDDDLYMAAFSRDDGRRCLRLLLGHAPDVAASATTALSAPVSTGDTEAVRALLEGGVDPRRYADNEPGQEMSAVYAAVRDGSPAELIGLLITYGADPGLPGPDGHSPAWLAAVRGRDDLAGLLGEEGSDTAGFVAVCMRGDRAAAAGLVAADPGLVGRLAEAELASLVHAAEAGNETAVSLMLDLGFPIGARRAGSSDDDGAAALHAAAYAGSVPVVRLLLDRGAEVGARDGRWESTALDWAIVGSGERPATSPHPDWTGTVLALLAAGAPTEGITLSPEDPKPPSPEVAELLRAHGADTS
jgi:ankyrin repeat protein